MYDHEFKIGDRVSIEIGQYEGELTGAVVKLWNSPYITVQDDDGYKYAGPEYNASFIRS